MRILNGVVGSDDGNVVIQVLDLYDVGAVGLHLALAIVVSGIVIASSPLEVHDITLLHVETVRREIVFRRRIHLYDVPALSTYVEVVNLEENVNMMMSQIDRAHTDAHPTLLLPPPLSPLLAIP